MTDAHDTPMITRVLDAPREQVWTAWTAPKMLARWWWPERFQTTYKVDLHEGGQYRFRTADLPDMGILCVTGTYLEIRCPERMVYTWHWENSDELSTRVTVKFAERDNQTELQITHQGFATEEEWDNHVVGWTHCIDRLQALLADTRK